MNTTTNPSPTWRARLGVGLALVCLVMLAGCGNDLSEAAGTTTQPTETTRTTEATGVETTTADNDAGGTTTTSEGSESADGGGSTGLTLPDGTELTLPDGVELTIPDGMGECVEAGAALTELSLAVLGGTSTAEIDEAVDTLKTALGPASTDDIEVVTEAARKAAKADGLDAGGYTDDAFTEAFENLTARLSEVCGGG